MNSLSKSVNKINAARKHNIYVLSNSNKKVSKSSKKLRNILKRKHVGPSADSSKKELRCVSRRSNFREDSSTVKYFKQNKRYFDRRKFSTKKRVLKSSLQLPKTTSNKSMRTRPDLGNKSVQIKSSLNVKTVDNESSISLNQGFKHQMFEEKRTRNHPYNPYPDGSIDPRTYSPLIKGIKSGYKNDSFINSYSHYRDRNNNSSLSSFTDSRNKIASLEFQKFRKVSEEKKQKDTSEKGTINNLIKSTQKQLKCLSYKLSTVISDGNYHNLLEEGQQTRIEVIEDTLIYCKVGLKYKYSPMTIRFKYNTKENLRVFYSTLNKMPHELDYEHQYHKPKKICIWAQGRNKEFDKDYAYLALLCRSQIPVDIVVKFNTMEKALGKKKMEKMEEYNIEEDLKNEAEAQKDEEEQPKPSPRILKEEIFDDIIKKNMKIAGKWKQIHQEKLENNKNVRPKRIEEAKAIQKKLFLQNLKQKKQFLKRYSYQLAYRWDIIRELREKARLKDELNDRLKIFNGFWKRLYDKHHALNLIYTKFYNRKQEILLEKKKLYCANRIKRNFRSRIVLFAPYLFERNLNHVRYGINSVMPYFAEPVEIRAKNIFADFLTKAANKNAAFTSFLSFAKSADRLNQFYKRRIKIKAINKYVLDKIWEKGFMNLTQSTIMSKSKSKKKAKEMKKIYRITNDTKEQALKCLYDHMDLEYKIKFVLYRRMLAESSEETGPVKQATGFSSESSLHINQAMYRELNTLLFPDSCTNKKNVEEKKESSRKSSHRNNSSKRDSHASGSKTKKSKSKSRVEFNVTEIPVCNFDITQGEMEVFIKRIADLSNKKLAKLAKLANLPARKPNSDL
ncbi:unnamed protein product [Moneuplotes crassus]|uniref:Uncharacterized protein n=1 Tax=Euplotes crassus TaxID=5936 RepID=A0AAD2D853_EUPCR|nr:unnamed protein product [Moneuplotes crassus]